MERRAHLSNIKGDKFNSLDTLSTLHRIFNGEKMLRSRTGAISHAAHFGATKKKDIIVFAMNSLTEFDFDYFIELLSQEGEFKKLWMIFSFDILDGLYFSYKTQEDFKKYCYKSDSRYCLPKSIASLFHSNSGIADMDDATLAFHFIAVLKVLTLKASHVGKVNLIVDYLKSVKSKLIAQKDHNTKQGNTVVYSDHIPFDAFFENKELLKLYSKDQLYNKALIAGLQ
jgi:hypothetical protein